MVIGVIAIVIGLLLPALSSARRSVGGITCESNFRQWAMATQMYANENNGFLPRRGQGVGATYQVTRPTDWFNALPPLMKMKEYGDADPTVKTLVSSRHNTSSARHFCLDMSAGQRHARDLLLVLRNEHGSVCLGSESE